MSTSPSPRHRSPSPLRLTACLRSHSSSSSGTSRSTLADEHASSPSSSPCSLANHDNHRLLHATPDTAAPHAPTTSCSPLLSSSTPQPSPSPPPSPPAPLAARTPVSSTTATVPSDHEPRRPSSHPRAIPDALAVDASPTPTPPEPAQPPSSHHHEDQLSLAVPRAPLTPPRAPSRAPSRRRCSSRAPPSSAHVCRAAVPKHLRPQLNPLSSAPPQLQPRALLAVRRPPTTTPTSHTPTSSDARASSLSAAPLRCRDRTL